MSLSHLAPPLSATVNAAEWAERLVILHRQLYASEEVDFDEVMTHVYAPPKGWWLADHCLVHDGTDWHLYYVTGPFEYADEWIANLRAKRYAECRKTPYEMGDAHAAGPALNQLECRGLIMQEPQAEFGTLLQGTSNIARFEDHWVNVYTTRGPEGEALALARSRDLHEWEYEPANPIWRPPDYARSGGSCKNAHIVRPPADGRYLIYYCVSLNDGTCAVGLLSTQDFAGFADHGPVFKTSKQMRGTAGTESPTVVCRNGMWHLFVAFGPGYWHAVSPRPDDFLGRAGLDMEDFWSASGAVRGSYFFGRFHCMELFEHAGQWWMTSTRKEYQRYLNRRAGILKYRGSAADEASLLPGLFLARVEWEGDRPIPVRVEPERIP
ncbi:MAG: hypothetical protein HY718_16860 [Planctomycetes bacterium]|nr:hypothetical protein [Planctomycetota bacterium]